MPIDLLFYVVIAVVLVFWLRNTLGTKNGSERDRSDILDQLKDRQQAEQKNASGRIVDITDSVSEIKNAPRPVLDGIEIEGGSDTAQELLDFMRYDPAFDPARFIAGAKEAFPMIVESFSKGDLRTLKMLLSEGVYSTFEQVVEDRQVKGESVITDVLAVRNCKILGVKKIDKMVFIKLRFIADETVVIRDREGHIVSGNPDKIVTMNDVWTFGRDPKSKDPTWYLYETSDDVPDDHPTPIPNAK